MSKKFAHLIVGFGIYEYFMENITNNDNNESYEKQREEYERQYREWYEAHGKAQGADPNPPQ